MISKIWKRFLILLISNTLISIVLTVFLWLLFGRKLLIVFGYLEIDFFNTVCGVFSIIGLGIAIYQIAAIRSEQEIVKQTTDEINTKYFKIAAVPQIKDILSNLLALQSLIANTYSYNPASLTSFLERINTCIYIFDKVHNHQITLECAHVIDCENCLVLLNELQGDFSRIMDENLYLTFKKQLYNQKVSDLISQVNKCDIALKP